MKKITHTLLLLTILIFQSCSNENFEDTVSSITLKTAYEVEKEIPTLKIAGIGGSMRDDIINHEKLVFNHTGKINEDRGVVLLTKVIGIYLKNIYSEERLKKYLKKHPFTYKNLQIVLIIYKTEGDDVYQPDYGYINLIDGVVSYQSVSKSEKGTRKVKTEKQEPYEEAAKRLGVMRTLPLPP